MENLRICNIQDSSILRVALKSGPLKLSSVLYLEYSVIQALGPSCFLSLLYFPFLFFLSFCLSFFPFFVKYCLFCTNNLTRAVIILRKFAFNHLLPFWKGIFNGYMHQATDNMATVEKEQKPQTGTQLSTFTSGYGGMISGSLLTSGDYKSMVCCTERTKNRYFISIFELIYVRFFCICNT